MICRLVRKMKRALYLLKTYLWTVVVFIIAKVAFMYYNQEGHDYSWNDLCDVVRHGLSLDLSTALYFIIFPFLVVLVSLWWNNEKVLRRLLSIYYVVISIAFALAFVADSSLYPFWGFKLDASCLQYLETPTEAMASVSTGYLIMRLLVIGIVAVLIYMGYHAPFTLHPHTLHTRPKIIQTLIYVLLIPLIVIGIRGGLDESTTNIGQVYFSQNQFLNHAAVNPVFSFLSSLDHQLGDGNEYQFMSDEECAALVKDVYPSQPSTLNAPLDSAALHSKEPSTLNSNRPNIVIILLESCGEQFASVMPRLQQLKQEGIWFSQCYGNSWRTDRGTVCTLSGYPSFPATSVMKIPEKSRTLPSIARTLQKEHYKTSFLYGGDINFTNMRSYLVATGWEQLTWKADYSREEQHSAAWGVRDDITFGTLFDRITQLPTDTLQQERALFGYSTLSSHEPWDVPMKKLDDEVLNAFSYLDQCLGDFIDKLKATPQWDNLLIVMTADHGINYKDIDEQQPLKRNHIPLLMVGGAVKEPLTVTALCNQTDISATLLGLLGLPHDDFRFSRDVLSESYRYPTAVHNYYNAQLLIDSTGYILYDFDAQRFTVSQTADPERLLRINKAILQTTTNDLMNR